MESPEPKTIKVRHRFDFIQEVLSHDDATRTMQVQLTPDPRRYDKIEEDGVTWYLDRFLGIRHSLETMAASLGGPAPMFTSNETVNSPAEYAVERREALATELNGGEYLPPHQAARPHSPLEAVDAVQEILFLSVDICGSTALRAKNILAFDRAQDILLRELATVVGQFAGSVLKTTGDGFIAYVDHPAFCTQCDLGAKLGLALLEIARGSLAPALEEARLPVLEIRIGADYGKAEVRRIAIPATGYEAIDIASDALNRAVKVQESAGAGEFRIGFEFYRLLHGRFLERCRRAAFDGAAVGLPEYEVYALS